MIITPQALRGIYVAFNTIFNKAEKLCKQHKIKRKFSISVV